MRLIVRRLGIASGGTDVGINDLARVDFSAHVATGSADGAAECDWTGEIIDSRWGSDLVEA